MSLPLPLAQAADMFIEPDLLTAFDITWTRVDGRQIKVKGPNYTFSGVIQPDTDREVSLEADGALSDGTMLLHTREVLGVADMSQLTGEEDRQTYVQFTGELWKVNEPTRWSSKTQNYRIYGLTKDTNLDLS